MAQQQLNNMEMSETEIMKNVWLTVCCDIIELWHEPDNFIKRILYWKKIRKELIFENYVKFKECLRLVSRKN